MNGPPVWWGDPLLEEAFRSAALAAVAAPDGMGLDAALSCLDEIPTTSRTLHLSLYLAEVVNALGAIEEHWSPRDRWHRGDVAQVWASAAVENLLERICRHHIDDGTLTATYAAIDNRYGPPAVPPRWRVVLRDLLATHWTPHDHTRLVGPANSGVIDLLRIADMGDGIHTPQLAEPTLDEATLSELLAPGAAEALIDWLAGLAPTMDDLDTAHHYIRTANTGDEEPW